jgi:capsule polysaccharide export protein KpsE/RkpR
VTATPPSSLDLSFLRRREVQKRVAAVTLAFAVAGLLYGLLAPKWYRSILTVVPARQQRPSISSALGGDLASLAAGFDASMGGGADANRVAAVLQSIAVSDAVIEKFHLRARYREKYQETTRDELWRHCDVKTLAKPGLVQLSCEDKDPRFVQEMLTYFADYGNQVFRRVSVSSASEEARFLEKRVAELRQQADESASRMREFQEKHRIVDLDTQAKAVVSSLATLNSQSITKEMELDYARMFSSRDEATRRQLEAQLSIVEEKARDLQEPRLENGQRLEMRKGRGKAASGEMFPAALAVPQLRAEFEKLYRDRKVAEATLVFALERLEGAKANEARDVSTFFVLDPPALPTKKSRPKRLLILAALGALGFLGALAWEAQRAGVIAALRLRKY